MIVKNLRLGYDGGGMCCGPVEGAYGAEVCVMDKDGHNHWILAMEVWDVQVVYVSTFPLLDVMIEMNDPDVDGDFETKKMKSVSKEYYEYECGQPDEDMQKSEFANAILLARIALGKYVRDEITTGKEFIEPYLYEDIDESELLSLESDGYEDEDE
ncbi:MAG: hypothetical protein Q4D07_06910 [Selenomonadaceae bacterium]|nr:hypothetical protein [Selenomonadaceae bacterium]